MKRYPISVVLLLMLAISSAATPDSCSCTAPDSSCSATVNCPGGCISFCGVSDDCRAVCSDGEGLPSRNQSLPRSRTRSRNRARTRSPTELPLPSVTTSITSILVTLKETRAESKQIARVLAQVMRQEVEFVPYDASHKFNFDYKNTPLWEVLEDISQFGKLKIGGISFEDLQKIRRPMLTGAKMSMCIHNVPIKNLVSYLSFLRGLPISVVSGDENLRITLSLRDVTFNEIITRISAQTNAKL